MDIKNKIIKSIIIATLGLSLIVGGTNAYFNDTKETKNTFEIGLMELGINKEYIIQIDNVVPGDTINRNFELTNDGTVDMKEVILHSSYEVVDKGENNNGDDLGDYINVEYLYHVNGEENELFEKRLSELMDNPTKILDDFAAESNPRKFTVRFSFVDNGGNQNHFQEDSLELKWEFEAIQRDGKPNSSKQ